MEKNNMIKIEKKKEKKQMNAEKEGVNS